MRVSCRENSQIQSKSSKIAHFKAIAYQKTKPYFKQQANKREHWGFLVDLDFTINIHAY